MMATRYEPLHAGLLLILTFLFLLIVMTRTTSAETLYVDDDGGADHTTIGSALENATHGDTIMIHPGSYEEELVVEKEVTIRSTTGNPRDVEVQKQGGYSIFWIKHDNVTISGLTIKHGQYMIYIHSSDNCLIENNIITMGAYGVIVYGTQENSASNNTIRGNNFTRILQRGAQIGSAGGYNIIEDNMFHECEDALWCYFTAFETVRNNTALNCANAGFYFHQSTYCTITNNTSEGNNRYGLTMSYSSQNTLRENTILGSEYNIHFTGTTLHHFRNDIDDSNTVNGEPIYYWVGRNNETVPADAGFVGIVDSENITVRDLALSRNGNCVLLAFTRDSLVENVDLSFGIHGVRLFHAEEITLRQVTAWKNREAGIHIEESRDILIMECNASDGRSDWGNGIEIRDSTRVTITNSTVNRNWGHGIQLTGSAYCTISHCNVDENRHTGIRVVMSNFNRIENTTANGNDNDGIGLESNSRWNHVENSSCTGNGISMLHAGVKIGSGSGNTLIHNNVSENRASGFYLDYAPGNVIQWNDVRYNGGRAGFYMMGNAASNTIVGNNVSHNQKGFELIRSKGNHIENNTIFNSGIYGIYIYDGQRNTITGNHIVNVTENEGIRLEQDCRENLIYNNHLHCTVNAYDDGSNRWNTSKVAGASIVSGPFLGGNFWGNYLGLDRDGDWLGDTPLSIPGGDNQDLLPLMPRPVLQADFTFEPLNPLEGEDVHFTDRSVPGEHPITYWYWDFGDNMSFSEMQNPDHVFPAAGTYIVSLTVGDTSGNISLSRRTVWVKVSGPRYAVNTDTGISFPSIQEAVNHTGTENGHVIEVLPGTYTENVWVGKEVTLRSRSGDPRDTILMPADRLVPVFTVTAHRVTISGFTITQGGVIAGNELAILLDASHGSQVRDCLIEGNGMGIFLSSCRNTTIHGNHLLNNLNHGIYMDAQVTRGGWSGNNTIRNNTIHGSGEEGGEGEGGESAYRGIGIVMANSNSCTITGNTMALQDTGLWLMDGCHGNVVSRNSMVECTGKGIAIGASGISGRGNSFNVFTDNTLEVTGEYSFFSEMDACGNQVRNLTIGTLYPASLSFTYNGTVGIKSMDEPMLFTHLFKDTLNTYMIMEGHAHDAWINISVHYDGDLIPFINETSLRLHTITTYGAHNPWHTLSHPNGVNIEDNVVWANITGWGDQPDERTRLYGVFGKSKYDLDLGQLGYAGIDLHGVGEMEVNVGYTLNPEPDDPDAIGIFVDITLEGTGTLEWLNLSVFVAGNPMVGDGDEMRIYYWNETEARWVLCEDTGWNPDTMTVWANISHLTVFAPRKLRPQDDAIPPVIVHLPVERAAPGESIMINAAITDNVEVREAVLYWRYAGEGAWREFVMVRDHGDTFTAHIPDILATDDIEYYLGATDGTNGVTFPRDPGEPFVIQLTGEDGGNGNGDGDGSVSTGPVIRILVTVLLILFILLITVIRMDLEGTGGKGDVSERGPENGMGGERKGE